MKHARREARSYGDTTYDDVKAPVLARGSTLFEVLHAHGYNACFEKGRPSGRLCILHIRVVSNRVLSAPCTLSFEPGSWLRPLVVVEGGEVIKAHRHLLQQHLQPQRTQPRILSSPRPSIANSNT